MNCEAHLMHQNQLKKVKKSFQIKESRDQKKSLQANKRR